MPTTPTTVSESTTQYIDPSAPEVLAWLRSNRCAWCGGKCGSSSCRLRRCDSCSELWIADTEADYDEFDKGGQATVAPHMEDCRECVEWYANLHLENAAPAFVPGDWMESQAVADYRSERMRAA